MKITYIHHSCFSLELKDTIFLFDYYRGKIPEFNPKKQLYVLSSHGHRDHFDSSIFNLANTYPNIVFILSSDINSGENKESIDSLPKEIQKRILFVNPDEEKNFIQGKETSSTLHSDTKDSVVNIKTLQSTDKGVAYLISSNDKVIFHSGDLHWWTWIGESEEEYKNMTRHFKNEVAKLKGIPINVAFLPLDPRQEERFYWGFDYYMKSCNIDYAFPMHFWRDYSVIYQLKNKKEGKDYASKVMDITKEGEIFYIQEEN